MTPKNAPEFIALIKRYESITLEEIEATGEFINERYNYKQTPSTIRKLTGFGYTNTCSLCKAVESTCFKCVYNEFGVEGCHKQDMHETYLLLEDANTPEELLHAIKARAYNMRQYAVNIGINIE